MIAEPGLSPRFTLSNRVAIGFAAVLLTAGRMAGQVVSTYLPPELLQRGNEPRQSLFQLGMFDLNPHVAASAIYDDNITLHSKTNQGDYIYIFSPGFDILKSGAGGDDSIVSTRLTYNPAFVFFTEHDTYDSIDHFLHWTGGARLARLNVNLSQDYESSSGGVVDVGDRVSQDYYLTSARVSYELTEKTSVEMSGTYQIRDYDRLVSSVEWLEDNAVNYQISSKVRLGIGISVGQLKVGDSPLRLYQANTNGFGGRLVTRKGNTQTFVTPSIRAGYRASEKTDVTLSFGGEWRMYEDGQERFGPVFSLAGTYMPWEETSISIEGHRREQNSAVLLGQDYITTGVGVSASQRFRERYRFHVQFTYDKAEYQAAKHSVLATRVDDYFLLRTGVDAILATSWTLGIFYQYRVNDSTGGFSFENQQIGLQTVWAY